MTRYVTIGELAKTVRSKNAKPFELTLDIILPNYETYKRVKKTGVITKQLIAKLYNRSVEDVITLVYFDGANAIKATIKRPRLAGDIGETDIKGAQQHAPLLSIEIPWE